MENQFDYIVVGAGSAGSVLANRLSADPKRRVLVLEAGRESHPWSRIPVGFAKLIENPAANWLYSSEPDAGTGQRRLPIPREQRLSHRTVLLELVNTARRKNQAQSRPQDMHPNSRRSPRRGENVLANRKSVRH